jgi:hypothetical protein
VAVLVEGAAKAIMVAESAIQLARIVWKDLLPSVVAITVYITFVLDDSGTPTGEKYSTVIVWQA